MRLRGAVLLALIGLCSGCSDSGSGTGGGGGAPPTVTVLVENADCTVADIQISPFLVEQINSGGAISLRITATVTCMGAPVGGAKLTFTIPGGTAPTTADTDENGKASARPNSPGNQSRIGQTVGVAVTGVDGGSYPKTTVTITEAP